MNFNNTHTNYLQRDPHSEDSPLMRSACKYVCMGHALRSCDSIALLCGYVTALLDLRARASCTLLYLLSFALPRGHVTALHCLVCLALFDRHVTASPCFADMGQLCFALLNLRTCDSFALLELLSFASRICDSFALLCGHVTELCCLNVGHVTTLLCLGCSD